MLNLIPAPKIIKETGTAKIGGLPPDCRLFAPMRDERVIRLIHKISPGASVEFTQSPHFKAYFGNGVKNGAEAESAAFVSGQSEGYCLKYGAGGAFVFAYFAAGLFYGLQTLRQLSENGGVECEIIDWPDIKKRSMHYDLRQTFPKFELLLSYIEQMAEFKANSLIIEYEDKFPFERLPFLRHPKFGFSDRQLNLILETARLNFIEIIPLQQSFGHLEYALKRPEFENMRETPDDLGEMCPKKEGAEALVKALLEDVMAKHPDSEYIHLGCDEVWSLGKCAECRRSAKRELLFIEFVNKLTDFVCEKGKKPIIWHDMLENCGDEELALLDNRATVMIWLYNSRTIGRDAGKLIQRLKKFGIEATGAAAARCHDGNDVQNVPNVTARLSNIRQWAETAVKTELPQAASTNWATAFAMGAPYGIFETSLYPAWFSGEKFWNVNGDEASFLARFLAVFHGIDLEKHSLLLENCRADDYYDVIFHIEDGVTKNRGIAEHLRAVKLFELGLRRLNSTDSYIYRYKRFRGEKGDMVSLKNRIKEYTEEFSKSLPELYRTLKLFLPGEMADMYMEARLAVPDFMNEHFYKGVIAELELG